MLRKVFIVIDFEDEQQVQEVQEELNAFSNSRVLDGKKLRTMLPMFKKHKGALIELMKLIAQGGVKAVLSMRGAQLINSIRK